MNSHTSNNLIAITGPTASGKTSLSIQLAKYFNGEIISADSRQVYRGLDIGSAKITKSEMQGVPHHLIDVADPTEVFTVSKFKDMADQAIIDIQSRGKLPLLVGGSPLYIDAVMYNYQFPAISLDPQVRKDLEAKSLEELAAELVELDPDTASTIDIKNKVRVVRAIENIKNDVPSPTKSSESRGLILGLQTDKKVLQKKIAYRTNTRLVDLIEEVKKLNAEGLPWDRLDSFGLEYRYTTKHLLGEISVNELERAINTKSWQFAKRQMTWLRRNKEIHWLKSTDKELLEKATVAIDGYLHKE